MTGKLIVVVGGQFGSEGKGAIAGYLAGMEPNPLLAVRVGGPNAGHTAYDDEGNRYALRQLPVAAVTNTQAALAIGEGSEVDPVVLGEEIVTTGAAGRIVVDPEATVITEAAKRVEYESGLVQRIGSTGKGVGGARAMRVMRGAPRVRDFFNRPVAPWRMEPVAQLARGHLRVGGTVMIEAAQGYGLGLHAGFYPKCTSGDCRAIDALAMAGLYPDRRWNHETWVVFRTHPIRVAGDSGPLKDETTWEKLATASAGYIHPEKTTVTQKIRRVGLWDEGLAAKALDANPGAIVALTMLDYVFPEIAGLVHLPEHVERYVIQVERQLGTLIGLVGTSPWTVVDRR